MSQQHNGAIYVAFGYEHFIMAAHSARTLREVHPEFGVVLVTNVPVASLRDRDVSIFDEIRYVDEPITANRDYKLNVAELSPFNRTVFLDSDTEVWHRLDHAFALLTKYDLAVHIMPYISPYEFSQLHSSDDSTSKIHVVSWNSGVLFWRQSAKMTSFFADWHSHYARRLEKGGSGSDQPSLGATIFAREDVRVFNLGGAWNATPTPEAERGFISEKPEQVRILHYREPRKWPAVGRRLAKFYARLAIDWIDTEHFDRSEIARYEALLKGYGSPLYQSKHGRRVLAKWYELRARATGNRHLKLKRLSQRRGRVR